MKFSSAATYDAAASVQHHCFDTLLDYCSELTPLRILDLGCGTGTTTLQLTNTFPDAQIVAVDHAADMLAFATQYNEHPNITYQHADIDTYTPDAPFDLILSNAAFQWLQSPADTLDRYTQHLSPNGRLIVSYFGPETFRDLREILDAAGLETPLASDSFTRFSEPHIVNENRINLLFPSFLDLLKHIKQTGTRPSDNTLFLTPGKARHCDTLFKSRFSHVKLMYQALFCVRTAQ